MEERYVGRVSSNTQWLALYAKPNILRHLMLQKKTVWLRKFINEFGVVSSIDGLVLLYWDSSSVIAQAKEPKSH